MTFAVIVQPEAEADLDEAFRWYEARQEGLGHEFIEEAARAFKRIAQAPLLPRVFHREARRANLRRFPYAALYVVRGDRVYIVAVLHGRRSPRRFHSRARSFRQ